MNHLLLQHLPTDFMLQVDGDTFVILDSFPVNAQYSETAVEINQTATEQQVRQVCMSPGVSRTENVRGWYDAACCAALAVVSFSVAASCPLLDRVLPGTTRILDSLFSFQMLMSSTSSIVRCRLIRTYTVLTTCCPAAYLQLGPLHCSGV